MRWRRVTGILLVLAGSIGLGTVADDLRHTGELLGVGGVLTSGLLLLVAGSDHRIARRLTLHRVAIGIGVGVAVGAAIDNMPGGLGCGAVMGALWASIPGPRRP